MAAWHPIQNLREDPVGVWAMIGPLDEGYATITLVRRGTEVGYRVMTGDGAVIGYFRTLMAAAKAGHVWFASSRGPTGKPYAAWVGAEQPR